MNRLQVLSHDGDTTVVWNTRSAEAGDPEALEAIREAERIFEEKRMKGAIAFVVEPDKPARKLEKFDPTVEQTIIVPRVAGG